MYGPFITFRVVSQKIWHNIKNKKLSIFTLNLVMQIYLSTIVHIGFDKKKPPAFRKKNIIILLLCTFLGI